jgi:two-component system response regulator FixJ
LRQVNVRAAGDGIHARMDKALSMTPPSILIVEDDDAVRASLGFALELEGFTVEVFKSGEDVLQRVSNGPASCVVLDERLPGLSGLQTLVRLRQTQPDMPGIIITSHPSVQLRRAASAASAPILEKPLEAETLFDAIRAQIDARSC